MKWSGSSSAGRRVAAHRGEGFLPPRQSASSLGLNSRCRLVVHFDPQVRESEPQSPAQNPHRTHFSPRRRRNNRWVTRKSGPEPGPVPSVCHGEHEACAAARVIGFGLIKGGRLGSAGFDCVSVDSVRFWLKEFHLKVQVSLRKVKLKPIRRFSWTLFRTGNSEPVRIWFPILVVRVRSSSVGSCWVPIRILDAFWSILLVPPIQIS